MKKLILIFIMNIVMASVHAQPINEKDIPQKVKTSFSKMFPDAELTSWNKKGAQFEASFFSFRKNNWSAVFTADGEWTERRTTIPPANLPPITKKYLRKHYWGIPVKNAAKITKAIKEVQYEVTLSGKKLFFDKNGIFLNEE